MAKQQIASLFLFGLTLSAVGGIWMVFNQGILNVITTRFWLTNTSGPTYAPMQLMQTGWNVIPIVVFIIGIIAMIITGMKATNMGDY